MVEGEVEILELWSFLDENGNVVEIVVRQVEDCSLYEWSRVPSKVCSLHNHSSEGGILTDHSREEEPNKQTHLTERIIVQLHWSFAAGLLVRSTSTDVTTPSLSCAGALKLPCHVQELSELLLASPHSLQPLHLSCCFLPPPSLPSPSWAMSVVQEPSTAFYGYFKFRPNFSERLNLTQTISAQPKLLVPLCQVGAVVLLARVMRCCSCIVGVSGSRSAGTRRARHLTSTSTLPSPRACT